MPSPFPSFPRAQQAQIIRANQRDIYHVSSLKDQTEIVLRSWLGTRWLTRWDKEVELLTKLLYYGLTTGRATQTLGEEYTDIWQHHTQHTPPSPRLRAALILLPTLPAYLLARSGSVLNTHVSPRLAGILKALPLGLEIATEINLAVFYLVGTYYDLTKRVLGVRHLSSLPEDPHTRPPSYSLLGILLAVRLVHRLVKYTRSSADASGSSSTEKGKGKQVVNNPRETYLDTEPISTLLQPLSDPEAKPAELDTRTMLDVASIPPSLRAGRNCTLCLEERTDSCATECGHLFCWSCIVGWGREKAECPLCRQALNLSRLLPIYNL